MPPCPVNSCQGLYRSTVCPPCTQGTAPPSGPPSACIGPWKHHPDSALHGFIFLLCSNILNSEPKPRFSELSVGSAAGVSSPWLFRQRARGQSWFNFVVITLWGRTYPEHTLGDTRDMGMVLAELSADTHQSPNLDDQNGCLQVWSIRLFE